MMRLGFCLAFAAAVATLVPTMATAGDPDRDANESRTVYQFDVRDSQHRGGTIDRIIVVGDDAALTAKTRHGVGRRNQARIDYSFVPFVGKLSEHRYDKEDFVEAMRIGVVKIDGNDLILAVAPGAAFQAGDVAEVAVLNGNFAYETRRRLKKRDHAGRDVWDRRGREIGVLYRLGDDRALALIRPFVVTDSALW